MKLEKQEQLALQEKLDLKEYRAKSVQKDHKVRLDLREKLDRKV